MVCGNCDSRFLEDHPVFEGALTARLARRIVADAKVMTFRAAARRHGVHWHAVRALVDTWSAWLHSGMSPFPMSTLGMGLTDDDVGSCPAGASDLADTSSIPPSSSLCSHSSCLAASDMRDEVSTLILSLPP